MDREQILKWLMGPVEATLMELGPLADQVRDLQVGTEVRLLGRIDISNYCSKECLFCNLAANGCGTKRYRMEAPEIIACGIQAKAMGCETIVLRAGLDPGLSARFVTKLTGWMKAETDLPLTLSLGERRAADLFAWKKAGADRYLLPLDTTDRVLYRQIHPPDLKSLRGRIELLRRGRKMGFSIGGGIRVGLPGQTWATLAQDLASMRRLAFDYFEVGPFSTRLTASAGRDYQCPLTVSPDLQVPNDDMTTLKVLALVRLLCPKATVLGPIWNPAPIDGRTLPPGVRYGVNAQIRNLTPRRFWARFQKPSALVRPSSIPARGHEVEFPFAIGH